MRRLRAQDTCSRFGISRKARKRINCSIQVFVAANCPAAQIVVIYVSPTRHQDSFAGNKSRHRRPFPPFRFRQSSLLVCGFTTRAWPPSAGGADGDPSRFLALAVAQPSAARRVAIVESRQTICLALAFLVPQSLFPLCIQSF